MQHTLADRLQRFEDLTAEERAFLDGLTEAPKRFAADAHLSSEDATSVEVYLLTAGYAFEYRMMREGGRQIIRLLVPGDIFNQNVLLPIRKRSNVLALTDCRTAAIQERSIDRLMCFPRLAKAWTLADRLDDEALRESIIRLGSKAAYARVAHFLCETMHRATASGLADGDRFEFPLNQQELGDLLGLSTVHTNRCLRALLDGEIIQYNQKHVRVLDKARLQHVAEFSNDYLRTRETTESRAVA